MTDHDKPKSSRRSGDAAVLALAEGLVAALSKTLDVDGLRTLKDVVLTYPDDGHDGAGEVVTSLTGLLDDMLATGRFDRDALKVHVRAWRFMVSQKPYDKERLAIMDGLRSVRDLYVEPKADAA